MSEHASPSAGGQTRLVRRLSPLAIWALSFGCAVGWGSFVMPGTTFLPIAGPIGTAIGIAVGALVMLIIGINYHYLMNRFPDAGGTFTYSKQLFGYDHGFLSAWYMGLVYLAIIWANATALPLIFRCLFGDLLQFGFHYVVAGYDIYLGEILLSLLSLLIFGAVCLRGGKVAPTVQIILALLLAVGVAVGFALVMIRADGSPVPEFKPAFSPVNKPAMGSLLIVFLAPWAYAGFESVSHSTEEFRFSPKKALGIMIAALATSAAAYILLELIAVTAQPKGCVNWVAYLRKLGNYHGLQSIPVFHAIHAAAGVPGLVILGVASAAAIITGLIGNTVAASRMIYSMAREDMLPPSMAKLNRYGAPKNAILFLLLISLPIPFLGRSAIGWIIDVNTIGVTIAYAYTSAAAFKSARQERRPLQRVTGLLGLAISAFFLFYFLIPNLSSVSSLSSASYLMLILWSVLGFVVFFLMFRRDRTHRLGKSTVVWVILLVLIFSTSMIWIIGTTRESTYSAVQDLNSVYTLELRMHNAHPTVDDVAEFGGQLKSRLDDVTASISRNSVIQFLLILVSMLIIFRIYNSVQRQRQSAVEDKTAAEQSSQAKTTFLFNMSHDIRTPMNAIVGYVTLAKMEKDLSPKVRDYLGKIETSSGHLLALINDILEMSRIESGRMELAPVPTDVYRMMDEVKNLFSTQMEEKGLTYTVSCEDVADPQILCDQNRLNRVLLNLISNAYKFTPEGGTVAVTLRQTGREGDDASFRLSVKDTGIGMSPEFAKKVFDAYEREKTATVENIQGTGLGTAITKSIVELMGGTIEVFSEQGKGSEFVVNVSFPIDPAVASREMKAEGEHAAGRSFAGLRVLLAEDDADNREVEKTLLEEAGFTVDTAGNGEEAVEAVAASAPGTYALVLMDVEMPEKNGYDATKLIRSLRNASLANIPIVALTAKAFSEDIAACRAAGMNAHIAKPLNMKTAMETLSDVLKGGQA